VLELLAAQAAISLENARLYETLENRVRERTHELSEALDGLRQTQRHLVAKEKLASLGLLTSGIAHELRNPLNFVVSFADASAETIEDLRRSLEAQPGFDPAVGELLEDLVESTSKIAHHGRRADDIVRSMLQHAGSVSGRREETDLNRIVSHSVRVASEAFEMERPGAAVTVRTETDPALPPMEISPQEIGQVVLNLMSNACYAAWQRAQQSGATGTAEVQVTTRDAGDRVEIRVRDNGTGIPAAAQDKIFLPFFTTKPAGDGTGLGLSLSHDIVTGHSGTLEFSTREGEGSEFVLALPKRSFHPRGGPAAHKPGLPS
jgi:signal transduction histidine kinase